MTFRVRSDLPVPSPPFARHATVPELYLLMRHFKDRAIAGATIDQLSWLLRPIMSGHKVMMRTLGPGTRFFRGRVMTTRPTNVREVGYPLASLVREDGRANRAGKPMLYVTTSGATVAFETRAHVGDMLAVVEYEVTRDLPYMALGYTHLAAARLGSTRAVPDYGLGMTTDRESVVEEFLAEVFTAVVETPPDVVRYRASIAVAENFLANELAEALLFPTVSGRADADNLAIRARFADRGLKVVSVSMWEKVEESAPFEVMYAYRDVSQAISEKGDITWLGRSAVQLTRPGEWMIFEARSGRWYIKDQGIGEIPEELAAQIAASPR